MTALIVIGPILAGIVLIVTECFVRYRQATALPPDMKLVAALERIETLAGEADVTGLDVGTSQALKDIREEAVNSKKASIVSR